MGSIGWFAKNSVAANLLMLLILTGGLITVFVVRQEVFPEFSLDLITVTVEYRGAAPAEVEEGVCVRIEEAIQGLDGVKRVTSVASEGFGTVTIELLLGADGRKVLDDVKARVDAIDTFPAETEKAVIREITNRRQVIDVAVWGDAEEKTLRHLAEQVRDELSVLPEITLVELANARPYEVSIEVSEQALRRYGLTFDAVANAVRRSSLDLPGGSVKTEGGEILLRTKGQAYRAPEFEELVLISRPDGTHLRLGAVASVVDGFADTDQATRLDGKPAFQVQVFRVGNQDALSIADAVFDYMESAQLRMPDGVHLSTWQDSARILRSRRNLLLRNAIGGLLLVFGTLALFLRFRLAFWVVVGMLISFMGAIWLMPTLDVSINMISLFAFILVLGIVVDDAIVAGENIYTHQHRHGHGLRAAIEGAREVSVPVVFAVLTTVAAFVPLLFVAGTMGKVMRVIPLIVIPCLLWSLVESLWILPAHLSHYRHKSQSAEGERGLRGVWHRFQYRFAQRVEWFVFSFYSPVLEVALRWRYVTLAVGVSTLLITLGFVSGGHMRFIFFPDVESDYISAALTLPPGTPAEVTSDAVRMLEGGAEQVRAELEQSLGADQVVHRISAIGEHPFSRSQSQNAGGYAAREMASHLGEVTIELLPAEDRGVSASEIAERWRDAAGLIPDAIALDFTSSLFEAGNDVDVQLTGPDIDELRDVALELKRRLATFNGVYEIADSFRPGKEELKLTIKPAAEVLGLTLVDLGRQVRQAFYGEEAQRIQRGRDDVRVMVRYPVADRRSLGDLENMRVRTPDGREVPFSEVALVEAGRGFASIKRVDRRRAINVTADVDSAQASPTEIIGVLVNEVLPEILYDHPGVAYTLEGQQAEQRDTLMGLARGFAMAALAIFALLAVPLRSYAQPFVIMLAIPFGLVGAVWGHLILGLDLTILSMFGLVALTGVVVNDSLVMVAFINRRRATLDELLVAVRQAGVARFRPILLTSLTTFAGLFPLLMERSMQARFLIPMAASLAFGVVFATFITLILIPCGYLIMEDIKALPGRWRGSRAEKPSPRPAVVATPQATDPPSAARVAVEPPGLPRPE
jgi:multidrug efflux pump subunit AcrB